MSLFRNILLSKNDKKLLFINNFIIFALLLINQINQKMSLYEEQSKSWSPLIRVLFKFTFSYFTLFVILLFLAPFLEIPLRWFAENILNWGGDFHMESTGSGDRSFDYVRLALNIILAAVVSVIWSLKNNEKMSYYRWHYWFQVILRVFLFAAMMLYGLVKVFKGQFSDAGLELLLQPVGEMSPMGLAWTFMGHSMMYNIFLGVVEVFGGILLLNRKTVTFGSFVIMGIMANVFMMNLAYDVPVKLFSFHLLLMSLILFIVDWNRIKQVFFKNETTEKVAYFTPKLNKPFERLIKGGKGLVKILITVIIAVQCFVQFDLREQLKEKSDLYGIWETQIFVKNRDTLKPILTDDFQWRYLIVDSKNKAAVKKMNETFDRYNFQFSDKPNQLIFLKEEDSLEQHFSFQFKDSKELSLNGVLKGDTISVYFKRKPKSDFRLINRGFHWVNESTYNY